MTGDINNILDAAKEAGDQTPADPSLREKFDLVAVIDGEEIKANRPKIKLLRTVFKLDRLVKEDQEYFTTDEGLDQLLELVVEIFNNEKLTMENIEEADLGVMFDLGLIYEWMEQFFPQKKITEQDQLERMRTNRKQPAKR